MTRLQTFMEQTGIKPVWVTRAARVSRQHLLRLRKGKMEPTRPVMVSIAEGCSLILHRRVHMSELFDLGDNRPQDQRVRMDAKVCNGVPCIAGTRVTVLTVLASLAAGDSDENVLRSFPALQIEDIRAAIDFAARAVKRQYHREDKR